MGLRTTVIPQRLRQAVVPLTARRAVVAMAPNGGWVAAVGSTCVHHTIPAEMSQELESIRAAGLSLDAVAFTPSGGGWTVVAGSRSRTRNVGGTGLASYHNRLRVALARGRTVRSIAFNPVDWGANHGYVVVWDDGTTTQRAVPAEMAAKLAEFTAAGGVQAVAFTPLGGWTILGEGRSSTRGVGGPEPSYHQTVSRLAPGGAVQAVAFNPQDFERTNGWILLTSREFEGRQVPLALASRLRQELRLAPGTHTAGGIAPPRSVLKIEWVDLPRGLDYPEFPYLVLTAFRGRMGEVDGRVIWLHPNSGPLRPSLVSQYDVDFGPTRPLEVFGTVTVIVDQKKRATQMERTIMRMVSSQFVRAMSRWSLDIDRLSPEEMRDVAKRSIDAVAGSMREDLRRTIRAVIPGVQLSGFVLSFWVDVPGLSDQQIVMLDEHGVERANGGLRRPGVRFESRGDWFGSLDGILARE